MMYLARSRFYKDHFAQLRHIAIFDFEIDLHAKLTIER